MKPFVSIAAVAAAVTALAVTPVLSQAQSTPAAGTVHKKSHIKARSGQRPPGWRASAYDQTSADSASSNASKAEASSPASSVQASDSGASNSPTPYPPTLRPANFYARDANGSGGKTLYPDPAPDRSAAMPAVPEHPIPDPLCAPRGHKPPAQPNCPSPAGQSSASIGTGDSHAPDK